jgi:hypothetical protein
LVSQQICPACATPNSTYAPKCRNCGTPLNPRPLPGEPVVTPWGGRAAEPAAPSQALHDGEADAAHEYEMAPRVAGSGAQAAAAHDPWPAERLTPSRAAEGHTGGLWTSLPHEVAQTPSSNGHPSPALTPSGEAPAEYEAPPPAEAALPDAASPASGGNAGPPDEEKGEPPVASAEKDESRPSPGGDGPGQPGPFSFHLEDGGGAALGNGRLAASAPAQALPGAETPTSNFAATFAGRALSPQPAVVEDAEAAMDDALTGGHPSEASPEMRTAPSAGMRNGGRGWGIRESRTAAPAWAPSSPPPDDDGGPRPSGSSYSAGTPFFGVPPIAAAAGSWGGSTRARRRSGPVRGLFAVLILVVLIFAAGFWYFAYGPGAPHTVSAPATLGGLSVNNSPANAELTSAFQSRFAGEAHVRTSVFSFYGNGQSANGYVLGLFALNGTVRPADLNNFVSVFNSNAGSSSFDLAAASPTAQEGVTYRCGPVALSSFAATVCVWSDVNVIGWVAGLPGESGAATLSAAEQARSTGEH